MGRLSATGPRSFAAMASGRVLPLRVTREAPDCARAAGGTRKIRRSAKPDEICARVRNIGVGPPNKNMASQQWREILAAPGSSSGGTRCEPSKPGSER